MRKVHVMHAAQVLIYLSTYVRISYCSSTFKLYFSLYGYVHKFIFLLRTYTYVTLSHLRSKESTGIHKPCIPILLHI